MSNKLIDLERDVLIPVHTICAERLGKRVSPATLWRWRLKGCNGVKLECVKVGSTWFTTAAAFAAFIEGQTAAATPIGEPEASVGRSEETIRRLRAVGLL